MNKEITDVVILGGGMAGLTLALQLRAASADTRITILEKGKPPFPDACFKVGESTVELGARYLAKVLGDDYLSKSHLQKTGMRFFFSGKSNDEISNRVELGLSENLPMDTFQLDRGRFETDLWELCSQRAITVIGGSKVTDVALSDDGHTVVFKAEDGSEQQLQTRWVVDATGRRGFLRNQLGLTEPSPHKASAVWFRVQEGAGIDQWSSNEQWKTMFDAGFRNRSTNHLLGSKYWVWNILLPTGATSYGIVAHADEHDFDDFNTLDRALAWLHKKEPQCARALEAQRDKILDFGCAKNYAYGCKRLFSPQRWAITGEAGVFIDPFFSPGADFIGISNSMITAMISRDLRGEDVDEYVEFLNKLHLDVYQLLLGWLTALYPALGNDQAMVMYVSWYFLLYISFPVTLFLQERLWDMPFMASIQQEFGRFAQLSMIGIGLLTAFAQAAERSDGPRFVSISKFEHVLRLQRQLISGERMDDDTLRAALRERLATIESTLAEFASRVGSLIDAPAGAPWADPSLLSKASAMPDPVVSESIASLWYAGEPPGI